jgi:hypothetical protein
MRDALSLVGTAHESRSFVDTPCQRLCPPYTLLQFSACYTLFDNQIGNHAMPRVLGATQRGQCVAIGH